MQFTRIAALASAALASLVVAAGAAGTSAAAEVQIYGRADTGLLYTHVKGGDDTLEMKNGRSTPRFGFNIKEDIAPGWKVKGYLENGYQLDSGNMGTTGKLFDRRAILAVSAPWGEVGAGRAGTVQSTVAPYSMGLLRWDPFATSYGNASIASTFLNTGRVNNGLHFKSSKFGGGFSVGASYSLGDEDDDAVGWSEKSHTLALAGNYQSKDLMLGLTFANIDAKNAGEASKADARMYQAGGWWAATPALKLFAAAGYQTNGATGGKLSSTKLGLSKKTGLGGFTGESALLGAMYTLGANKLIADVQHFSGKLDRASDVKFHRTVVAGAWEYWFSKRTIAYLAASWSMTSGKAEDLARKAGGYDLEATQVYCGIDHHF